ncbi:MAG: hypothetical protein HKO76_08765 [Acidimicrobiia bacterium]|nr:hypothetical protein [Acidimicrobiia bacterium]
MRRDSELESNGFYRGETQLDVGVVTFDFTFRGELDWLQGDTENTGMEFYVDTGTVLARVALLYSEGTSYLGIFTGGAPENLENYAADITSWQTERTFRLKVDPTGQTSLSSLSATDEGVDEQYFAGVATGSLPASSMPGPGIGFLNNATSSTARGALFVKKLRYMTGMRSVDVAPVPAGWGSAGTGTESVEDGYITLDSTDEAAPYYFFYDEQRGDPENGNGVEFRARVKSYSIGGEDSPIRSIPGAGVIVNDGTNHTALIFADSGPPTGKVIFLAKTDTDYEAALIKIRASDESVEGTYVAVDWSIFHLYRLQRTVGGALSLFIDNSSTPALSVEESSYDYPISQTGQWQIRFGNVVAGALVKSQWRLVRYNISRGLDFSVAPRRSENEILATFGHAFNNIVELRDDANLEFSGTPGQFDTVPQDIEDFEEDWP